MPLTRLGALKPVPEYRSCSVVQKHDSKRTMCFSHAPFASLHITKDQTTLQACLRLAPLVSYMNPFFAVSFLSFNTPWFFCLKKACHEKEERMTTKTQQTKIPCLSRPRLVQDRSKKLHVAVSLQNPQAQSIMSRCRTSASYTALMFRMSLRRLKRSRSSRQWDCAACC
jgi:hypothetical protein